MSNPFYQVTVTCAVCGKLRGSVNHWFVIQELKGLKSFEIWPLVPRTELNDTHKPVCGDECAHKLLQQFLSELRGASPSPSPTKQNGEALRQVADSEEAGIEGDRQPVSNIEPIEGFSWNDVN